MLVLTIVAMLGVVAIVAIVAIVTLAEHTQHVPPPTTLPQACTTACATPDSGLLGSSTVFTSAITIMGFAAFSSALAIRIDLNSKKKDVQWYAKFSAFGLIIAVIVSQAVFLLLLLGDMSDSDRDGRMLSLIWIVTTASLLLIIAGLITIGSSYSGKRSGFDSASGGSAPPSASAVADQ